ncbi:MAG: MFS transporter [Rhodospirillaceae bacterium]|nr:MFS transporter [Rhodospirillaceae bacterium]
MGALLRIADFRKVWGVGVLGGVVRWLEMLAFAVYVFDATNSPFLVALVSLSRMAPLAFFGAVMGALADRVPREKIVLGGLMVLLSVTTVLAWLAHSGYLQIWHLIVGALINGCYWSTDMPARRTLLGAIAGTERTAAAMGLDASTNSLTRALGPVTGGLLVAFTGLQGALMLGAVLYGLAILLMISLLRQGAGQGARQGAGKAASTVGIWRTLKEGLAYAAKDRAILGILIVTVIFNIWVFPYTSMIAVIGRDVLALGPFNVGLLMSVEGTGSFSGAMAVALWARPSAHSRIYFYGAIFAAVCAIIFALSPLPLFSGLMLYLAGVGAGCFGSMQATRMLLLAPAEVRSRLMGGLAVCIGLGPLGYAHLGLMADWLGAVNAITIMGVEALVALALAWLFWPEIR